MQRPNTLHNKIQQPVEEKIQLHKDPTHGINILTKLLMVVCSTPLQTMNSCTQRPNTLHQSMSEPLSRKN